MDALYEYLHTLMTTFVTVVNMIMWATKVNTVCPVVIVNLLTNHYIYIYIYIYIYMYTFQQLHCN
jgi:hypothetical protein